MPNLTIKADGIQFSEYISFGARRLRVSTYSIMDVSRSLKISNPQKYYMKMICNGMYYIGFGNCWYESREDTLIHKRLYLVWAVISNFYTFAIFFDVFLANCRSDLNDKEKNDVIQFTLGYLTISAKIIFHYIYKKDIIVLLERLLEGGRSTFVSADIDKACVRRFSTLCIVVVGISYMALFATTVDGIRAYFIEGMFCENCEKL